MVKPSGINVMASPPVPRYDTNTSETFFCKPWTHNMTAKYVLIQKNVLMKDN